MLKDKVAKREAKQEERSNTLQSGLFFWIYDSSNSSKLSQKLNTILKKYKLHLNLVTAISGRKAYYLTLSGQDPLFKTQSLYPELDRKSHITIDCEYYKEYAPINDRIKWHYCHYTEEYYKPNTTQLLFTVHQYLNKLGNTVLITLTNKLTDKTTLLTDEQNTKIHLNLERASHIVNDLIEAKNSVSEEYTAECKQLCEIIATSAISSQKNHKNTDSGLIDENISRFKTAAKLARRYADNFLQLPEKYLINLINSLSQDVKTTSDQHSTDETSDKPIAAGEIGQPTTVTPLEKILNEYNLLKEELSELTKDKKSFLSRAQLDGIMFSAWNILNKLLATTPDSNLKQDYNALVQNISKFIQRLSKPEQSIQTKLKGKPNDILHFLQDNFHAIEKDIPPQFYFDILNKTVTSKSQDTESYINICEFLRLNSTKYLAILKPPYYDNAEKDSNSIYHIVHQSFLEHNPKVFEMLLTHGVKLDGNVFSNDEVFGISLAKCLIHNFSFDLAYADNIPQASDDFKTFLKIMFDPRFRAGFEYVNTLTGILSRKILQSRAKETIKVTQKAERNKNVCVMLHSENKLEKSTGVFSVLDFALMVALPGDIIKIIADNIHQEDIPLLSLAKNFGSYAIDNTLAVVINDDHSDSEKFIVYPDSQSYAATDNGTICPRIYLSTQGQEGNPTDDIREAMLSIIKLFNQKLESTNEADYKSTINRLLEQNKGQDINRCVGACLMLIANNNYDKNWKLLKLFNCLLQIANFFIKDSNVGEEDVIRYIYFFHAETLYNKIQQQPDTPEKQQLISQIKAHPQFENLTVLALMYKSLRITTGKKSSKPRP